MEAMVHAAVAELKKVQFAAVMETLGNEALGKMMNIVDEAELESESRRPQTSFLNILRNASIDVEHSYGARAEHSDRPRCSQASERRPSERRPSERRPSSARTAQLVVAVSIKDEDGNTDLGAIAESQSSGGRQTEPVTSDLQVSGTGPGFVTLGYFACAACGKLFTTERNLKAHHSIHAGEKPFGSGPKSRQQQSGVRVHVDRRPYACQQCGKCFSKQMQLKTHAIIHTGEKPHGCEVCGRRFNLRQNLKRHAHTHTGQKVFVCCVCGKGFTRAVTLKTHTADPHGPETLSVR
ncbi:zinc finger protein 696-like [Takifugu rubripes]|uniref:zinc finger protein 696-like n=1 Tax=Takifugu rubripes TaxID=31033 RepID=UPI001145F8EF|nr:zinc finger protein 696-like [Takifugu rubripes]